MRAHRLLGAAAVLSAAGCTFLVGPTDLVGRNAPRETLDSGEPDGLSIANGPDGSTDASSDAGVPDNRPFCERAGDAALHCDEFERDTIGSFWSLWLLTDAGTIGIVAEPGNRFVRATVKASPEDVRAIVARYYTTPPTKFVRFAFSVRAMTWPLGTVQTMGVYLGEVATSSAFVLLATPAGFIVSEQRKGTGGGYKQYTISKPIPLGQFTAVELRIAFDVQPPRLDMLVEGETALSVTSQVDLKPGKLNFSAGCNYSVPTPDAQIDVDDVLIDYE